MTILVLDDEVQPDYRYLGPEIERLTPDGEYHVYADDPETPDLDVYDGVIISGSTASVYEEDHAFIDRQRDLVASCLDSGVPLLGICFGHQLVNDALGGRVVEDRRRATFVGMDVTAPDDPVLDGVGDVVPVLHADLVVEPGRGMETIATTDYNDYFCTRHESAPIWTVQYHPEFTERVEDNPSDWSRGGYDFADSNATATITNFAAVCERRAD
ncbi:type 1 glutamine amidotransferase [Haloplanus rallus]|jgi:GMP synthase (glutamine-hydrolysing)|uniref:Type 1 glutamine amidotransferase n=1 Tax=Haloplanus rallus TaxID=1816183 RepID=A0A6B9FF05_9EURY|nr:MULTISPECIES: type 1 glutamine amidotransferase [Haloplanus]QGX95580.1 type 1 glutamine amidotransferase [Haloplanus rallus]